MTSVFRKSIFFVLTIIILASCSKDDPKPASVVGKWTVQSGTLNLLVNDKPLKDYLIASGMSSADADATIATYMDGFEDFDATGIIFEFTSDGKYTQKEDATDTSPITGTWTQSSDGKTLTITDDTSDGPLVCTVKSVTSTDMALDILVNTESNGGFTVKYVLDTKFKKS